MIFRGISIIVRALHWVFNPDQVLLNAGVYHALSFLNAMINEIGLGLIFLMMNAQRTEENLKKSRIELQGSVEGLEKALTEIKTLRGIIPICSHCKKIRDDEGYWNRIESYLHKHSEAELSHSICPDCAKEHYPDLNIYEDGE